MTEKAPHLRELGAFLRARRADVTPAQVGLPERGFGPRRVPGLRREEVADLAAISHDYYTRVEQGRLAPSESVLEALIRVLSLDDDQAEYARELARQSQRRASPRRTARPVRPQVQRILDQLIETPALVFGRHLDIVAWNDLAAALLTDFGALPPAQRNYAILVFTDPAIRELYTDWDSVARTVVAVLRMAAADSPHDPRLAALVDRLSADEDFRALWAARRVARQQFGTKRLHHPVVGDLTLDWDSFRYDGDPDQQLVMWSAEPGTASHDRLRILASWSMNDAHRADSRS